MFIYFAHPIDQVKANTSAPYRELRQSINRVTEIADMEGHTLYQPGRAFKLGYDVDGLPNHIDQLALDSINRHALQESDALVAILIEGIPTLGVPAEIEQAINANKPTLILTSVNVGIGSVQVQQWQNRGARVEHLLLDMPLRLTESLTSLPRPAEFPRARVDVTSFGSPEPQYVEGRVVSPADLQVRYDPAANHLTRAYPSDAGFDLATMEPMRLTHGVRTNIRTGVHAPPPDGWWGLIKTRSSTPVKYGITVHEAVIDAGYQGELMIAVTLTHTGLSHLDIGSGTRLAQYILHPAFTGKAVQVAEFAPTDRGTNGYGSSGA